MKNKNEWTLILNPCYKQTTNNNKDFDEFIKQVNYKDKVIIHYNGSWIEGEIRGFNHARVYIFNEFGTMSEHEWQYLKMLKKHIYNGNVDNVYFEQKVNIIAIVFTILIFICTFALGYIYSYLPDLFIK